MIVKLKGYIEFWEEGFVDLNVHGVVYRIFISQRNLDKISDKESILSIHVFEIIKENERLFFGFLEKKDREVFSDLLTVQGVGGKMALNIMSNLDTDQIIQSILSNDENFFSSISGVGNKLALRIINELKSKAKKLTHKEDILSDKSSKNNFSDLVSCLINLGYPQNISEKTSLKVLEENNNLKLEELIPIALKYLSKPN